MELRAIEDMEEDQNRPFGLEKRGVGGVFMPLKKRLQSSTNCRQRCRGAYCITSTADVGSHGNARGAMRRSAALRHCAFPMAIASTSSQSTA
jgi:hypothetical protein